MDINKRTVLWIVFAVSLIVLWNNWMVANGKQSLFSPAPPAKVAQQQPAKPSDVPTAAQPGSTAQPRRQPQPPPRPARSSPSPPTW